MQKSSTSVSPKRKPAKNIEEIIRQTMNRKALEPQRIHKATLATLKRQPETTKQKPTAIKNLKS